ncbi:MAG: hypothetical protein QM655_02550 [Nocardioidaceae bacterium]
MTTPAAKSQLRATRLGGEAIERARLAVVPRVRRPAPRVPFAMLVGLVLLGGVVGLLMFNTSLQKTSFVIADRQVTADRLHAREQQLQLELDKLRDPQALAVQALDLGMRPPDAPAFLKLGSAGGEGAGVEGEGATSTCVNCFRATAPDAVKPPVLRPAPVILPRTKTQAQQSATADKSNAGSKPDQEGSGSNQSDSSGAPTRD